MFSAGVAAPAYRLFAEKESPAHQLTVAERRAKGVMGRVAQKDPLAVMLQRQRLTTILTTYGLYKDTFLCS